MGNQKQKWTAEEEDALHRGVLKYGAGKWKNILKDPDFAPFLTSRSNIDLKDKWRNLNVSNGQGGSKDKSRTPKTKGIASSSPSPSPSPSAPAPAPAPAPASVVTPTPQSATPAPPTQNVGDPSSNSADVKNPPRYSAMIFEALSTIQDTNGSDISTIFRFIEQRHKVSQNFRRALGTRLRRLVSQGKVEKVQNCYKIKKDSPVGTKSPKPKSPPKEKDVCPGQSPASSFWPSSQTLKEAAEVAAYRIADAENKEFLAAEAAKEAESLSKLAEESEAVLQLVTEIYERGLRGEIVHFPINI